MIVVAVIATTLIGAAAVLALVRLERGPSMLDRTVAFDILTTTIVGAVAVEAAWSRRTESIPILAVLSLVGFVGSVSIARFAAREPDEQNDAEASVSMPGQPTAGPPDRRGRGRGERAGADRLASRPRSADEGGDR